MRTQCLTLLVIASLFTVSSMVLGSPPTIDNPYRIKKVTFDPKPELDKWSTIEITLQANHKPMIDRLNIQLSGSRIEFDLPMPEQSPKYLVFGIPYEIAYKGREGQLPSWTEIGKGDTHTIKFMIRPYWFGECQIHIQGIDDWVLIGMGKDGRSIFTGTLLEMEKILGPRKTQNADAPDLNMYSPRQMEKRDRLMGLEPYNDTLSAIQRSIAEIQQSQWLDKDERGFTWHQQGTGSLFRVDMILKNMPKWGEITPLEVRIRTRLPRELLPSLELLQSSMAANVKTDRQSATFEDAGDGDYAATIAITPVAAKAQTVTFRVVSPGTDAQTIAQLPVYGFYLNFDEHGNFISIR